MGSFYVFITPVLLNGGQSVWERRFFDCGFLFFLVFSGVNRTGWGVGHDCHQYRRIKKRELPKCPQPLAAI